MALFRGELYYIKFPYTFDARYPNGKNKFVLVLQDGEYFEDYDTVVVLLITSDSTEKDYATTVTIESNTTSLKNESYVVCAQPYTIKKSLFEVRGVWGAGKLAPHIMDEVDEKMYIGLCMGKQNE